MKCLIRKMRGLQSKAQIYKLYTQKYLGHLCVIIIPKQQLLILSFLIAFFMLRAIFGLVQQNQISAYVNQRFCLQQCQMDQISWIICLIQQKRSSIFLSIINQSNKFNPITNYNFLFKILADQQASIQLSFDQIRTNPLIIRQSAEVSQDHKRAKQISPVSKNSKLVKYQYFQQLSLKVNLIKPSPMHLNSSWCPSQDRIVASDRQLQLIHTLCQEGQVQETSLMLSLSTYLRRQDSGVHLEINNQESRYDFQTGKTGHSESSFLSYNYDQQKTYHQNTQEAYQDQQSQSFLLLESQIKQNNLGHHQDILHSENEINQPASKQLVINGNQNSQSGAVQKILIKNRHCTDSIQLLQLLAIPGSNQSSINSGQYQGQQINQLKQMYLSLLHSNQQIINQVNFLNTTNFSDLQDKCLYCPKFDRKVRQLQNDLCKKTKCIEKYQQTVENLNSTIFDLKMQNKKLLFQNHQYNQQIQKTFIQSQGKVNNSGKHKTTTSGIKQESFQTQVNKILLCAHDNLFRKQTKIEQFYFNSKWIKDCTYQNKVDPQTPTSVPSQIQYRKQEIKCNKNSDKDMEIATTKFRQPSSHRMTQTKTNKLIKKQTDQHQLKGKDISHHKGKINSIRFSDLSKLINNNSNQQNIIQKGKMSPKPGIKQGTPVRKNAFLKVKNKDSSNKISNSPINKFSKRDEDSEIETQKFYGFKKDQQKQNHSYQNDQNMLNLNLHMPQPQKNKNTAQVFSNRINLNNQLSQFDKNSVICKSFKQIGTLHYNNLDRQNKSEHYPLKYECADDRAQEKNQRQNLRVAKKSQKSERQLYSPSPHSLGSKRQKCYFLSQVGSTCQNHKLNGKRSFLR